MWGVRGHGADGQAVVSVDAKPDPRPLSRLVVLVLVLAAGLLSFLSLTAVARAAAPIITEPGADAPASLSSTSEQVQAAVNPGGQSTTVGFSYGTNTNYTGSQSNLTVTAPSGGTLPADTTPDTITATITGLTPGQIYHYQAVASNQSYNGATGPDATFIAGAPGATVSSAVGTPPSTVAFSGQLDPGGQSLSDCQFNYEPANEGLEVVTVGQVTPAVTPTITSVNFTCPSDTGSSFENVSATAFNVPPGVYDYWLQADTGSATGTSASGTFTIGLAAVATGAATQSGSNNAVLAGTVNPEGVAATYHFEWGQEANGGTCSNATYNTASTETSAGSGLEPVDVTAIATLTDGLTYCYRIVATTAAGVSDGSAQTITLEQSYAVTDAATSVDASDATLNGSIGTGGLSGSYYFEYGTDTTYGQTTPPSRCPPTRPRARSRRRCPGSRRARPTTTSSCSPTTRARSSAETRRSPPARRPSSTTASRRSRTRVSRSTGP